MDNDFTLDIESPQASGITISRCCGEPCLIIWVGSFDPSTRIVTQELACTVCSRVLGRFRYRAEGGCR